MFGSRVIHIRFDGELNDFIGRDRRHSEFAFAVGATDTIKHIVESIGVPHTEFGRITADGGEVSWAWQPIGGEHIVVFPQTGIPFTEEEVRFVLDGHLGRLAAFLRMLGFDVWYERYADDVLLASISSGQRRILLTRDVALLKRREIESGYWIRSHQPREQVAEVLTRFALHSRIAPFQRCMECNGLLHPAAKREVASLLPPYIRETKHEFSRCEKCGRVFWRGSHYLRMMEWIKELTVAAQAPPSGRRDE